MPLDHAPSSTSTRFASRRSLRRSPASSLLAQRFCVGSCAGSCGAGGSGGASGGAVLATLDALAQLQLTIDVEAGIRRTSVVVVDPELKRGVEESDALMGLPKLPPPPPVGLRSRSLSLGKLDFSIEDPEDDVPYLDSDLESDVEDDVRGHDTAGLGPPALARARSMELLTSASLLNEPFDAPASPKSPRGANSKATTKSMRRGLRRAVAAGVLLSLWPVMEALALEREGLNVYAFMVLFALSHTCACVVAIPVRTAYLKRPSSKSTPAEPMTACGRACVCGVTAGSMWYSGAVFVFVAGTKIGVTVAVSVGRCSPVVAALWGLVVWREAKDATWRASAYIFGMFLLYIAGILLRGAPRLNVTPV